MSGREVFEFRPELVDDDDEEADDTRYAKLDNELMEEVTAAFFTSSLHYSTLEMWSWCVISCPTVCVCV